MKHLPLNKDALLYTTYRMTLDTFKNHISEIIFERGEDYYLCGNVVSLEEITKNTWRAKVEGTDQYNVELHLAGRKILSFYCDCPYDGGPVCKHVAAVLLELKDSIDSDDTKEMIKSISETREERLSGILEKQHKKELVNFLKNVALNDDDLFNRLILKFDMPEKADSPDEYKKIIRSFLNAAEDTYGYIRYCDSHDALRGVYDLLPVSDEEVENENYKKAAVIAFAVIEELVSAIQFMDDSDGSPGECIDWGFSILTKIAENNPPPDVKEFLYKYTYNQIGNPIYNGWSEWKHSFLELTFLYHNNQEQLENLITYIDRLLSEPGNDTYTQIDEEQLLEFKMRILDSTGRKAEARELLESNVHLPRFKRILLEEYFDKGEYEKVLKITKEGIQRDIKNHYHGLVNEWKKWQLKVYQKTGDKEKTRNIAEEFILNGNVKYFSEWKNTFTKKEFPGALKTLIEKSLKQEQKYFSHITAEIYIQEKMIVDLLNYIKQFPGFITGYCEYFLPKYEKDVFELYSQCIQNEANQANNRKQYRHVCYRIRDLKKICPHFSVHPLIADLEYKFNHRPAFLDELDNIK